MIKQVHEYIGRRKAILLGIVVVTLIKSVVILYGYQNIFVVEDKGIELRNSYGWADLVENTKRGDYRTVGQFRLRGIVDTESRSLRPPVYVVYLIILHEIGKWSLWLAIIIQSVMTTLIAVIASAIVYKMTGMRKEAYVAFVIVFLFPMNLLKTGAIDEAVVMLVFLLVAILMLQISIERGWKYAALAGVMLGLAVLTRYNVILGAAGGVFYLLKAKRSKESIALVAGLALVLAPWVTRNFMLYNKITLSSGGSRILYVTTTERFAQTYPERSIDEIENDVMTDLYEKAGKRIKFESEVKQDSYFATLAVNNLIEHPERMIKILGRKLVAYNPLGLYPNRDGDWVKRLVYCMWYFPALVVVLWLLAKGRVRKDAAMLLQIVVAYASIGIVMYITARHMYPVILMLLLVGIGSWRAGRD